MELSTYIPPGAVTAAIAAALITFFVMEILKEPLGAVIKDKRWYTYTVRVVSWAVGAGAGWLQLRALEGILAGLLGGYFSNRAFMVLKSFVEARLQSALPSEPAQPDDNPTNNDSGKS